MKWYGNQRVQWMGNGYSWLQWMDDDVGLFFLMMVTNNDDGMKTCPTPENLFREMNRMVHPGTHKECGEVTPGSPCLSLIIERTERSCSPWAVRGRQQGRGRIANNSDH